MRKLNNASEYSPSLVTEGGEILLVDFSPRTKYIAVYGTLRLGQGNWNWHLRNKAQYITTVNMPGILRLRGLAATWVGKDIPAPKWCAMDIFEIDDKHLEEVHRGLDRLESGYDQVIFPFEINGKVHEVKFYHIPTTIKEWNEKSFSMLANQDYLLEQHQTGERVLTRIMNQDVIQCNKAENLGNFIKFYVQHDEANRPKEKETNLVIDSH